jgi:hypothetical protein
LLASVLVGSASAFAGSIDTGFIEQDPPSAVRFRLANRQIGEYRGVCLMRPDGEQTWVELATWLKPAVRVPSGLVLWAERVVLLKGVRSFLESCERSTLSSH